MPQTSSTKTKELNILLLGETGVGKSTWINGFANYLLYQTLEEAEREEKGPVFLVPTLFTITDNNCAEYEVSTGTYPNERTGQGQSATQHPTAYVFSTGNGRLRLIDTPGIGDTRGIVQDKDNFQAILNHVGKLDVLHGICVLLKPNDARLHVMFKNCINELLKNLHRDACRNIVFCFTNSRSTFYSPGDTIASLKALLNATDVDITLNRDTIYCIDNEAVRYLAAVATRSPVTFDNNQRHHFSESWSKSARETGRLVERFASLGPHLVKNTLSINDVRQMIVGLTRPLVDITVDIRRTVDAIDDCRQKLLWSNSSRERMVQNLYIPTFEIKTVLLKSPLTVCTSQNCMRPVVEGHLRRISYQCSRKCRPSRTSGPFLSHPKQNCSQCGCLASIHKGITYETHSIETKAMNIGICLQMIDEEASIKLFEEHLQKLGIRRSEMKAELKQITATSIEFARFLIANAIVPYNNAMSEYLKFYIRNQCGQPETVKRLENILHQHDKEIEVFEFGRENAVGKSPSPQNIKALIESLYSMRHVGETIKNIATAAESADISDERSREVMVDTEGKYSSDILKKLALHWQST